jgi:hypothetical protein
MYSTCLFCSASLGTNEAIESFPVGHRVAFDAWKGRLWAVCGRCGRWNLAPIEERWEAVEAAEKLFVDTRTRVHSQNIGLARLPDGTRLVRVGEALPGELAAWRYGSQFVSRRRRNLAMGGLAVAAGGAIIAGLPLLISAGVPIGLLNLGVQANMIYQIKVRDRRVVHRVPAAHSPTGREMVVRRVHLRDARLEPAADGNIGLTLQAPPEEHAWKRPATAWVEANTTLVHIVGEEARRVLTRVMSDFNATGAKQEDVQKALKAIEEAGGPEAFARRVAATRREIAPGILTPRKSKPYTLRQIAGTFRGEVLPVQKIGIRPGDRLPRIDALALEMALNEESERQALEGELAALEAAWREAEEIAAIADRLTDASPRAQQQE